MSTDTYITFDGIEGESHDDQHRGAIEVLSWSWGVTNSPPSSGSGAGRGQGKATAGELHFMHVYDKASPVLAKKSVQGVHIRTAVLTTRRSGEGQRDFLMITLSDVLVTSISVLGAQDDRLSEAVSLAYGAIEVGYKPQDAAGGLGGEVRFKWNVKTTEVA
ncbi:MAG: Hcp family type VI secretion system effector [Acidimicrobiia bacterium]